MATDNRQKEADFLKVFQEVTRLISMVHDPQQASPLYSQMLASLSYPDFPTPIGVIRQIERPTYENQVQQQIDEARAQHGTGEWKELLHGKSTWTVEAND